METDEMKILQTFMNIVAAFMMITGLITQSEITLLFAIALILIGGANKQVDD
jgi:hypothetical protein